MQIFTNWLQRPPAPAELLTPWPVSIGTSGGSEERLANAQVSWFSAFRASDPDRTAYQATMDPSHLFQSCSLPARPVEIPKRISSSSLPPSFASGRCTVAFLPPAVPAIRVQRVLVGGA
jgi:hypothetical protein